MQKRNLFASDCATYPIYIVLRTPENNRAIALREHCEALWERFEPCADDEFVTELGSNFSSRYWEMYLAIALIDMGFELTCPKPGPDIGIMFEGRRIWFEATSPTRGEENSPDKVPELQLGVVQDVPNDKMILRYLNSITSKRDQYNNCIKKV